MTSHPTELPLLFGFYSMLLQQKRLKEHVSSFHFEIETHNKGNQTLWRTDSMNEDGDDGQPMRTSLSS
jgi:hypothetical protein